MPSAAACTMPEKRYDEFERPEETRELNGSDVDRSNNPIVDGQIHDDGSSFLGRHATPPPSLYGGGGTARLLS